MEKILGHLFSMRTMAIAMFIFFFAIARATFFESNYDIQTAKLLVYNALWFEILLLFLSVNLIANIFRYRMFKRRKIAMFTFHLSFLVIILGAGVTRYVGYEGLMVIREGESSNFIYLADPHVWVRINDGKMQYTAQEKKFMSEITDNSFEFAPINFPGRKDPISISYVDFKKKQIDSILIDKKYDGDVLDIVTDGMRSNYLAPNNFVTVGNIPISYNKKNAAPGIHISSVNGDLMVVSKLPMRYLPMSEMQKARQTGAPIPDSLYKNIPTDSMVPFYSTTLYLVEDQQFVFRRQIEHAKLTKMSSGKKDVGLDLLTLKISDGKQSKIVTLEGGMNAMPTHEVFEFKGLVYEMEYGSTRKELPFSIVCRDFKLDKYAGSDVASSFASDVTILDEKNNYKRKQHIFMNNVMDYGGYRFFQSSYELDDPKTPENEEATKLSVNYDFWGTNISYLGYLLMGLGMIFSLFASEGRFKELSDKIRKSRIRREANLSIWVLVFSTIGFMGYAQDSMDTIPHEHEHEHEHEHAPPSTKPKLLHNFISEEHSEELSSLLVQDFQGRIVPMHTLCDQLLRKVYGANKYAEKNAVQTVMSIHMYPEYWLSQKMINVPSAVREKLKLGKYASFLDLYEESRGEFKWINDYNIAHKKLESRRDEFDKKIIKLVERFQVYSSFLNWDYLKILPLKGAENNTWFSPMNGDFKQNDSIRFRQTWEYLNALHVGSEKNTWGAATDMLTNLKRFQRETAPASILPSETHVKMEIRYNKMNIFKNSMKLYILLGLALLILFFVRIFIKPTLKSEKIIRRIALPFTILLGVVFLYHASGLIMRWYISGHAPWSNGYEAVVFIAWVSVLAGFIFSKKNPVVLAGTAILAFCIIFVTEMSLLDPEITPLQPVLKSYWLKIHVAIITGSYGFLGLGAILGFLNQVLYIFRTKKNGKRISANINEITYVSEMTITIGLFMLTIGTFLGGIWANESWGRYWGWDPKETWALCSVLVFAIILHLRYIPWLNSKFTFNFWSFWGYGSILFTFFGVNFYLVGLHSYAQGEGNPEVPGWISVTVICFLIFSTISYIRYLMYKSYLKKSSTQKNMEKHQIYDFKVLDIQGNVFDWNTVKGKKILVVNTASECGYTRHYAPLELLYKEYKDKNFVVMGFPCNDFGAQEPGSDKDVAEFCERNYGVTFPMMAKINILGDEPHPLYSWLKSATGTEVAWNFQKYLIDEKGDVLRMIEHRVDPDDAQIIAWING